MLLYSYFKKKEKHHDNGLPNNSLFGSMLIQKEIDEANKGVEAVLEKQDGGDCTNHSKCGKYSVYTAVEGARIGKYAVENGTTKACKHFPQLWKRNVPEETARHLKNEYLKELSQQKHTVESIPTKQKGRPLLL